MQKLSICSGHARFWNGPLLVHISCSNGLGAKFKRMQRCRPKEDLKKNLTIKASESNPLWPIIKVFIRANGVEEWSIRGVFNLEVSLHHTDVLENRANNVF